MKKVLLLGNTGKMGIALRNVFSSDYTVVGKNSADFDAFEFDDVEKLVKRESPDIVINTVAFLGIDPCEKEPQKAFLLNALYPKFLAELSNKLGFLIVHFSTDAVFNNQKGDFYRESDNPRPINVYGFTKYGGDCFISAIAERHYIFRVAILFGETSKKTQFVEKMLDKIDRGDKELRIADDIVSSPSYSLDIAYEVKRLIEADSPFGLYHIANEGKASLYDLMKEIATELNLNVKIERASYKDFASSGIKNTYTPISSEKIGPLRPWQEAVKAYCSNIKAKGERQ